MSRLKTGGYTPLFDRLDQLEGNEKKIDQWLDTKNLKRSVFKELNRITQTRSRLTFVEYMRKEKLTVLDYGIPDFYGHSIQNSDSRNKIHDILKKAFIFFEPRLKKIGIRHVVSNPSSSELNFEISGELKTDKTTEPVTFLISSDEQIIEYSLEENSLAD